MALQYFICARRNQSGLTTRPDLVLRRPQRLGSESAEEISSRRIGVEFKRADAPHATRSMHLAITDAALDELRVVYPGTRSYPLDDRIAVRPLAECIQPRKRSGPNGE